MFDLFIAQAYPLSIRQVSPIYSKVIERRNERLKQLEYQSVNNQKLIDEIAKPKMGDKFYY